MESASAVAKVGARSIELDELKAAAMRIHRGASWSDLGAEARTDVLDALVSAELLTLEGMRRGLDRIPEVRFELEAVQRRELAALYFARQVWRDTSISPAEIRTRYRQWGSGEQLHLAHILTAGEEEAWEILAELADGASFSDLARKRSKHAESAAHGGNMGFLRRGMVLPEISAAVWELSAGQVHQGPIATSMGYHIVEVLARRRLPLEKQLPAIRQRLKNEKKMALQRASWRELERKYQVEWQRGVAAKLARREALPEVQNLFEWRGGALKASQYLLRGDGPKALVADTLRIRRLAEQMVMEELAGLEAVARGYDTLEVVRQVVDKKRGELMAQQLFAQVVTEPSAAELEHYFLQHRDRYRGPQRLTIQEILVATSVRADSLHAELEAGADMAVLARHFSLREDRRQNGGIWEVARSGDPHTASIYRAALAGEGLLPPIKVAGGYALVRVLEKEEGRLLDLDEAAEVLIDDYAAMRMNTFIDSLRQEYEDRIEIDTKKLTP